MYNNYMKKILFSEYRGLRKELYILFIGRVMTNMGSMIWPILTLILNQKLNLDATSIALALTLFTIVAIPVNLIGGKLADKYNKRNIIIICDIVSIIIFCICYFMEISLLSICFYAVAALFQTMEHPAYDALVADFSTTKDRSRAFSLAYLGTNLGLILSPTIAGILFKYNLNLAFLINACSILLSTILIFLKIKDVSKEIDIDGSSNYEQKIDNNTNTFKFIFANALIILYFIMYALESGVYAMYNYLVPLDLVKVFGDDGSVIFGTLSSLNCITVVLFTSLITKLTSKVNEITRMIFGMTLHIFGYLIFVLFTNNAFMGYIAMFIFTIGEILNTISFIPYLTKRIPSSHRGRILSVSSITNTIAASLTEIIIGQVYDNYNNYLCWIIILIFGLSQIFVLFIMKKKDIKIYPKLYNNKR